MGLTDWKVFGYDYLADNASLLKRIVLAVAVGVTVHRSVKYFQGRALRQRRAAYKKDVVILHQFNRGKLAPNISPFCLKLETYLRRANIPYENDFRDALGPLGKAPWITYNDHDVHDSWLCIEYLNKEFDVNLNSHLNAEQVAVGHMIEMAVEHHTKWIVALHRWVYEDYRYADRLMVFGVPTWLVYRNINKKVKAGSRAAGIGLHPRETIYRMTKEDFRSLSTFLGKKKFLFGDQICEYDCVLFAWLAMCVWNAPGSQIEAWVNDEFRNLKDYTIRMKEVCWPDWESCLRK